MYDSSTKLERQNQLRGGSSIAMACTSRSFLRLTQLKYGTVSAESEVCEDAIIVGADSVAFSRVSVL